MKSKKQRTSVMLSEELYSKFQSISKIPLQNLVERSLFLYVTDEEYQTKINNQLNTIYK